MAIEKRKDIEDEERGWQMLCLGGGRGGGGGI